MPQLGNLVYADGQAIPVNHTFYFEGEDDQGRLSWVDRSSGIPVGFSRVNFAMHRNKANNLSIVQMNLAVPVVETPSGGLPRQVGVNRYQLNSWITDRAPEALRKDGLAFTRAAVSGPNSQLFNILIYGENYYR